MKLSKAKKEQIKSIIISHKFNEKLDHLELEFKDLAEKLIKNELSKYVFNGIDEFLKKTNCVYVGDNPRQRYADVYYSIKIDESIPVKFLNGWSEDWYFGEDIPEVKKMIKKRKILDEEICESKRVISDVLNSCNTDKQLLDTIPEIKPFVLDIINTSGEVSIVALETINKAKALLS